jgi:FAD/FMN-containing dehydrogenase
MATVTTLAGLDELRAQLRGEVITPDDAGYDDARKVYNAMIDKRPALVARCRDVTDVQAALAFGQANGLDIAVRGAGHNGAGFGTVDDGLVIDLSPMRWVRVDPAARTAQVGGGCMLGDIDHATHAFGLAFPVGIIGTTGVGLLLGGGVGHLTRKYGLTIDNILGADIVLADGSFVRASEDENADLFWAIRGGGGNFGVVTALTVQLHPVSTVIAGPILWPLDQAADVLAWYREFLPAQPDELTGFFAFLTVPPGPPFPEALHMQKMCGVAWCYGGDDAAAVDELLKPARELGTPALDGVMALPLPAWNGAFDALYPPGDQWYWRGDYVKEIPDAAIDIHVEFAKKLPTWKSTMHLYPSDGAASRVAPDATPWSYREAKWTGVFAGVDPDRANADAIRAWTIDYFEALHQYSMGGSYVNFMMEEGQERVQATYGPSYARLASIKAKYDPANVFHVNQNIKPAS